MNTPTLAPAIVRLSPTFTPVPSPTPSPKDDTVLKLENISSSDEIPMLESELEGTDFTPIEDLLKQIDLKADITFQN
jgi:hypothetical protein